MIKLTCETCGKEFYRYPKAVGRFCSRKCYHASRQQDLGSPRKCKNCGETKPIENFLERKDRRGQRTYICSSCRNEIQQHVRYRGGRQKPKEESRDCSIFLGVAVAENALSNFFENIQRMPPNNPGYDFICGKGFKIDCKSSCLHDVGFKFPRWEFMIRRNHEPDFFLLLAFDNRDNLNPLHVWLVPGEHVHSLDTLSISSNPTVLSKWERYERSTDKVMIPIELKK